MKRREAFKRLGLLTIVGASSVSLLSACINTDKKAAPTIAANTIKPTDNNKSDRDKLIVNRTHQTIVDKANPTKAELKHSPEITFGEQDKQGKTLINVTVGQRGIIHPSKKDHWIDYLTLFINDKQYAHTDYINGGIRAYESYFVSLNKNDKVRVESACNLHGIWTSEIIF